VRTFTTQIKGAEFKIMRLQDAMPVTDILDNPERIVSYLRDQLPKSLSYRQDVENFVVVLLNVRSRPSGFQIISTGTLDTLLVHPREVFKPAIVLGAAAMVLAHNHPSGVPSPSEADIKVTRDLILAWPQRAPGGGRRGEFDLPDTSGAFLCLA
jgi:DNA repair protein RadC